MKSVCNFVVCNFGFSNYSDFLSSLIHKNFLLASILLASVSSVIETIFGLQGLTILAFVILVTLELLTGLIAAKASGKAIESRKFGRFGLKIFVWITLLFVINTLKMEYHDDGKFNELAYGLLTWLHGTLFIYINIEYLISVLENLGVITGKKNDSIIKAIKNKFFKK